MVPMWQPTELYVDLNRENGTIYGTIVTDLLTTRLLGMFSAQFRGGRGLKFSGGGGLVLVAFTMQE